MVKNPSIAISVFVWASNDASKMKCLNLAMILVCSSHCCLAPCKSVTNYGPLTEPKFYIVKSALTQIPTSNGHISETKRAILDPLVPKFSSDRGLSPTHESGVASLFHPLSASFGQRNHFFGVFQVYPIVPLWSEYAPRTTFHVGKKNLLGHP